MKVCGRGKHFIEADNRIAEAIDRRRRLRVALHRIEKIAIADTDYFALRLERHRLTERIVEQQDRPREIAHRQRGDLHRTDKAITLAT